MNVLIPSSTVLYPSMMRCKSLHREPIGVVLIRPVSITILIRLRIGQMIISIQLLSSGAEQSLHVGLIGDGLLVKRPASECAEPDHDHGDKQYFSDRFHLTVTACSCSGVNLITPASASANTRSIAILTTQDLLDRILLAILMIRSDVILSTRRLITLLVSSCFSGAFMVCRKINYKRITMYYICLQQKKLLILKIFARTGNGDIKARLSNIFSGSQVSD